MNKDVTGIMDDQLARLEAKVLETIDTIQGLRHENGELKAQCAELEARSSDLERQKGDLENQLHEAHESMSQAEHFEEKRRLVEEKVGGLLSKLEALG